MEENICNVLFGWEFLKEIDNIIEEFVLYVVDYDLFIVLYELFECLVLNLFLNKILFFFSFGLFFSYGNICSEMF